MYFLELFEESFESQFLKQVIIPASLLFWFVILLKNIK